MTVAGYTPEVGSFSAGNTDICGVEFSVGSVASRGAVAEQRA
jgi:hypothetical protein